MNFEIQIVNSDVEFFSYLQSYFTNYLKGFNNSSKYITIGVSGGSMPDVVCPVLSNLKLEDRERIRLFPVDERLVPAKHEDNNVNGYLKQLNDEFSSIFLTVDENLLEDANFAALKFEELLSKLLPNCTSDNFPIFDILLLGLGPDGHTCSLFSGHKLLQEKQKWVSPIEDSPKPPPRRITITLPVIENATLVIFIVTGPSKAEVVREILDSSNEKYPPTIINQLRKNKNKHTIWLLDANAASLLSSQ